MRDLGLLPTIDHCAVGRGRFLVLPIVDGSTRRAPPRASPVAAYLADSLKSVPETYAMDLSSLAFGIHLVKKSDGFSASGTYHLLLRPLQADCLALSLAHTLRARAAAALLRSAAR